MSVIAHNLFQFDFFFLLNSLRSGVWRTKDISIIGKNPSDINFASIRKQIQFVNTIKYFQQSLDTLANSLTEKETNAISRECEKILRNDPIFSGRFLRCSEKKWVLNYLSSGKGTIPNELITEYDSLGIIPENFGDFFFLIVSIRL